MPPSKEEYLRRLAQLDNEGTEWDSHWQDLSDYFRPWRSRYLGQERNNLPNTGRKRNQKIINSVGTKSSRTLSAGMVAGLTSPARPWFRLQIADADLMEFGPVRSYLHKAEQRISRMLLKSNFYQQIGVVYGDCGVFGVSALYGEEDAESLIRFHTLPIGQYRIAEDPKGRVDTLFRRLWMTVRQLVDEFGIEMVSEQTRIKYGNKQYDEWREVIHVVEPNEGYTSFGLESKPYLSVWLERDGGKSDPHLRVSGYYEFPYMVPRWGKTGEDYYGDSPGIDSLGDNMALQLYEKRKAQGIEKMIRPPLIGPAMLRNRKVSQLPGDYTTLPSNQVAGAKVEPLLTIPPNAIVVVGDEIVRHEFRIQQAFYADLWLMMTQMDRRGTMTATEIAERHEEKMLALGPVIIGLQDELLDPTIDLCWGVLERNGGLPEAPPELQGVDLRVEYISIMAQAQKMLDTVAIQQTAVFVGGLVQTGFDGALDVFNADAAVRDYANSAGVDPGLIRSEDEIAAIREQRAEAQAQQQQQEQELAGAQAVKDLAAADTSGDNALTSLLGTVGGVAEEAAAYG